MALDGLYPSFVRINYASAFAPHTMTIPTKQWSGVPGSPGVFETWDAVGVAGDVMVEALVTAMLPNNLPTTTFISYEIYDVPVIDEPPVWRFGAFLTGQVGTLVDTGTAKAVSYTMTFKCADGKNLFIVNLDTPVGNVFGNVYGLSARDADIATEIMLPGNGWQGRQGAQPIAFSNITISLNKRLRRKYDMI